MEKVLIIGAGGQIGTELVLALRNLKGDDNVIAADLGDNCPEKLVGGPYAKIDVLDSEAVRSYIIDNEIKQVYLLAALLSATAENNPAFAWKLNMEGLFTILNLAKEGHLSKIFWPSSIAVFGPSTPVDNTPQLTITEPTTVYGISKLAGERWCEYYAQNFKVDVRSIRYPGLISHISLPGGGTTDYAVDIFYKAKMGEDFTCFLKEDTALPMMYMEDAIRATIELMETKSENVKIRSSYNLAGVSFSPEIIAKEILKHKPGFKINYKPDFRQLIADTWPNSIDDSKAKSDWGWNERFSIEELVKVMMDNVDVTLMK
tara:strand:- start:588 stop:1538 length:951 start_codon:yes stop_codon:yes gene_type:complete